MKTPSSSSWLKALVCGSAILAQALPAFAQVQYAPGPLQQVDPVLLQEVREPFPSSRMEQTIPGVGATPQFPVPGYAGDGTDQTGCRSARLSPTFDFRSVGPVRMPKPWDEVLQWCQNAVTHLEEAKSDAEWARRHEGDAQAAKILYDALVREANMYGRRGNNPAPNSAIAIQVGVNMALQTFDAANTARIPQMTKDALKITVLSSVYDIIIWAYRNLDQPYYGDVVAQCRGRNCFAEQNEQSLPHAYVENLRRLAEQFVNMQATMGRAYATNYAELKIAHASLSGARDILLASLLARDLACPIRKLDAAVDKIEEYLSCSAPILNRARVERIRHLTVLAAQSIREANCFFDRNSFISQMER